MRSSHALARLLRGRLSGSRRATRTIHPVGARGLRAAAARPARRAPRAAGRRSALELRQLRSRAHSSTPASRPREGAHRVDEPAAGPHRRGRGREEHALQRGELVDAGRARAATARRAGGAARRGPSTARRASTRSNEPARERQLGARRPRSARPTASPSRARRGGDHAGAPGCTSTATTDAAVAHRLGERGRLARPARRRCRARARPVAAPGRAATAWLPGPAAWRARRAPPGARRGRRCRSRAARRAASAPRVDADAPAATSSASTASRGRARRVHPQRDGAGLVPASSTASASLGAEVDEQLRDDPVGIDVRIADARRRRRRRAAATAGRRPTAAQHPVDEPLRAWRDRLHRRHRLAHRGVGRTPLESWYAPRRNAARTGGSSRVDARLDDRREEVVERPLPRGPCRRPVGHERAVAIPARSRAAAAGSSDVRERAVLDADQGLDRDDTGAWRHSRGATHANGRRRGGRRPRGDGIAACPRAAPRRARAARRRPRGRATPSAARRRRRATRPDGGCPPARCASARRRDAAGRAGTPRR